MSTPFTYSEESPEIQVLDQQVWSKDQQFLLNKGDLKEDRSFY